MAVHCGPTCSWIFGRLHVSPLIRGGTRVEWDINPQFQEPPPYTFQLQVGMTGNPYADDWTDVGDPVVDTYFSEDPEQRQFGQAMWSHYRLVLATTQNTYASPPQNILGDFDKADWGRSRAIIRQEEQRLCKKAGTEMFLLKRRLFGTPCVCLDQQTEEIRDPSCLICYGTGVVGGFFAPYPCFYVEFLPNKIMRSHLSEIGTQNEGPVVPARMLNQPMIHSYDMLVDKDNDARWLVHSIESQVELRGIPLILYPVELRMLPFTHVLYKLPISGQQDPIECPS